LLLDTCPSTSHLFTEHHTEKQVLHHQRDHRMQVRWPCVYGSPATDPSPRQKCGKTQHILPRTQHSSWSLPCEGSCNDKQQVGLLNCYLLYRWLSKQCGNFQSLLRFDKNCEYIAASVINIWGMQYLIVTQVMTNKVLYSSISVWNISNNHNKIKKQYFSRFF